MNISKQDVCATLESDSDIYISDSEIRIDSPVCHIGLVLKNRTSTTDEAHIKISARHMTVDEFDVTVPAGHTIQIHTSSLYISPEDENAVDKLKELYVEDDMTLEEFEEYLDKVIESEQEQQT